MLLECSGLASLRLRSTPADASHWLHWPWTLHRCNQQVTVTMPKRPWWLPRIVRIERICALHCMRRYYAMIHAKAPVFGAMMAVRYQGSAFHPKPGKKRKRKKKKPKPEPQTLRLAKAAIAVPATAMAVLAWPAAFCVDWWTSM